MKLQLSIVLAALAVCQGLPQGLPRRLQPHVDTSLKIVGGFEVDIRDVPFQVAVLNEGSSWCGGSILLDNWILTAGHCVDGLSASQISIRAGSTNRDEGGQLVTVAWAGKHPKFNADTLVYDVALLKLDYPLALDDVTTRVAHLVAPNTTIATGSLLTVSGWGTLHSGDWDTPTHLMAVMVPSVPLEVCSQVYATREKHVDDTMICAGVGGKDSCQGDFGGPIVNEQQVQVGVVSWGIGCGSPGYPGLYANLAHPAVHQWIVETAYDSSN